MILGHANSEQAFSKQKRKHFLTKTNLWSQAMEFSADRRSKMKGHE